MKIKETRLVIMVEIPIEDYKALEEEAQERECKSVEDYILACINVGRGV